MKPRVSGTQQIFTAANLRKAIRAVKRRLRKKQTRAEFNEYGDVVGHHGNARRFHPPADAPPVVFSSGAVQDLATQVAAQLEAGQRLVSLDGDLWRWDGYRASAAEDADEIVREAVEDAQRLADRLPVPVAVLVDRRALDVVHHEVVAAGGES